MSISVHVHGASYTCTDTGAFDSSLVIQTIKTLSTSISKLKETATKAVALKPRQEVSLGNDDYDDYKIRSIT